MRGSAAEESDQDLLNDELARKAAGIKGLPPSFWALSFAGFGIGLMAGAKRYTNQESTDVKSLMKHKSAIPFATRTLGIATLITMGSFFGCMSLFVAVTGISSFKEFGDTTRRIFLKSGVAPTKSPAVVEEEKKISKMDESQEVDYWAEILNKESDDDTQISASPTSDTT